MSEELPELPKLAKIAKTVSQPEMAVLQLFISISAIVNPGM
jgi:hypothetical protein